MFILAVETTGPVGSVAVIEVPEDSREGGGNMPLLSRMKVTTTAMSHLKNLMKMADELLRENGIEKSDLSAVAVSVGPGSFTGIRIGVSTGRAISQALGIPCISVPTLEVFREKTGAGSNEPCEVSGAGDGSNAAGEESGAGDERGEGKRPVAVIFNARRGQVYAACYGEEGDTLIEPGPYMLSEVMKKIATLRIKPLFYGDGIDAYHDTDEFGKELSGYDMADPEKRYQDAEMVGRFALQKLATGDTIEYGELLPDYMRESEAEQRLKDGSLEQMRKAKLERLMNA